jgi:hypothetical protein
VRATGGCSAPTAIPVGRFRTTRRRASGDDELAASPAGGLEGDDLLQSILFAAEVSAEMGLALSEGPGVPQHTGSI